MKKLAKRQKVWVITPWHLLSGTVIKVEKWPGDEIDIVSVRVDPHNGKQSGLESNVCCYYRDRIYTRLDNARRGLKRFYDRFGENYESHKQYGIQ